MIDIHSHILPHIDDGSSSIEESLEIARIAAKSGIRHIVASSHGNCFEYTIEEYHKQLELLQERLRQEDIPVELHPGMEIFMDRNVVGLLEEGKLLTINNTKYVLVEFRFEDNIPHVEKRILELLESGYKPILAHPERYVFMQREPEFAHYLEDCGCAMQLNHGSITGKFGERVRHLSLHFLDSGVAGLIATDTHNATHRTPSLERLKAVMEGHYSAKDIELLLQGNPERILKGETILRRKELRLGIDF